MCSQLLPLHIGEVLWLALVDRMWLKWCVTYMAKMLLVNAFSSFLLPLQAQDGWQKHRLENGNSLETKITAWLRDPKSQQIKTFILDSEWVRNSFFFPPFFKSLRFWDNMLQKLAYFSYAFSLRAPFIPISPSPLPYAVYSILHYCYDRLLVYWIILSSPFTVAMWCCSVTEGVRYIYLLHWY